MPVTSTLFDGSNLDGWLAKNGGNAAWTVRSGYMEVVPGAGDIYSVRTFHDFQLHVEFWLPLMPDASGQARANSGVYLQGLYEIQVLDSYGVEPKDNDCGALYRQAAPLVNACKKPEEWQTYDVAFHAPAFGASGEVSLPGRLTVFQNGIMIHNNIDVWKPTGKGLDIEPGQPGPILLQDHGNLVRFRNIWVLAVQPGNKI